MPYLCLDLNALAPYQPRILQSSKDRAFYAWSVIKKTIKQTKESESKVLCYIRSAAYFFHFQSTRLFNNNHATEASSLINKPKVRVYFRRIVYSGLLIAVNLLSEVTAVHLFNSLG